METLAEEISWDSLRSDDRQVLFTATEKYQNLVFIILKKLPKFIFLNLNFD